MLLSFLESKFFKIYNLLFCWNKYGLINSLKMNILVGSTKFKRTLELKDSDGFVFNFSFRGKVDQGVLSHFTKPGYYIEEHIDEPVRTILDCGANIGDETTRFRIHHRFAEIIAVEADLDNYILLEENCANCQRIQPVHAAVWSSNTELFLLKSQTGNPEASSVSEKVGQVKVKALTIPSLMSLRNWKQIDILKLDVEGAENAIFSGDTSWIECVKCLIFEIPDCDAPGTLQLIFERLSKSKWQGVNCGECLVLIRDGVSFKARNVLGIN
jgi:FkbM family methyltransferase